MLLCDISGEGGCKEQKTGTPRSWHDDYTKQLVCFLVVVDASLLLLLLLCLFVIIEEKVIYRFCAAIL